MKCTVCHQPAEERACCSPRPHLCDRHNREHLRLAHSLDLDNDDDPPRPTGRSTSV